MRIKIGDDSTVDATKEWSKLQTSQTEQGEPSLMKDKSSLREDSDLRTSQSRILAKELSPKGNKIIPVTDNKLGFSVQKKVNVLKFRLE